MIKSTEELLNAIKNAQSTEKFLEENEENFKKISLSEYLQLMLQKYKIEKSKVLAQAEMKDNTYGYELMRDDSKKPSRDKLIQLCMGYPLKLEEIQCALLFAGLSPLYPRDKRDAVIMIAIHKKYNVNQLNALLFDNKFALLF